MGDSGGDGGGGNCTRVDLGESLTICLRSKAVGKHSIPVEKWHGRPARESRARCACHNQTELDDRLGGSDLNSSRGAARRAHDKFGLNHDVLLLALPSSLDEPYQKLSGGLTHFRGGPRNG